MVKGLAELTLGLLASLVLACCGGSNPSFEECMRDHDTAATRRSKSGTFQLVARANVGEPDASFGTLRSFATVREAQAYAKGRRSHDEWRRYGKRVITTEGDMSGKLGPALDACLGKADDNRHWPTASRA